MHDKEKIRKHVKRVFGAEEGKVGNCHIYRQDKRWHMRRKGCRSIMLGKNLTETLESLREIEETFNPDGKI